MTENAGGLGAWHLLEHREGGTKLAIGDGTNVFSFFHMKETLNKTVVFERGEAFWGQWDRSRCSGSFFHIGGINGRCSRLLALFCP